MFRADKRDGVSTGEIPASHSKNTVREKLALLFLRQQHRPDGFLSGIKRETALLHPALSSRARNSLSLQPSVHHREQAFGFSPLCSSLVFPFQTCNLHPAHNSSFLGKSLRCTLYKTHKNKLVLILQIPALPNKDLKELYKQWIKP